MDHDAEKRPTTTLLDLVASGRRTAIGHLILLYEPLLEFWVRRYLGPRRFRAEGEDLLQVIRMALVKGLPSVQRRDRRSLVAWLRRVVRTQVVTYERRRRAAKRDAGRAVVSLDDTRAPAVAAPGGTPSRVLLGKEEIEKLRAAIERTPERYRVLLRFIFETDPTPAQLAAFTGKPAEAARKFTARAIEHLRRAIGGS